VGSLQKSEHMASERTVSNFGNIERILQLLSSATGTAHSTGLDLPTIEVHAAHDHNLHRAAVEAEEVFLSLGEDYRSLLCLPEVEVIGRLQEGFLNFYATDTVSPYVPIAACGPWIITAYGAVIYETGGYGMLGFGHSPAFLEDVQSKPSVMANIMTAQFVQHKFNAGLRAKIGHHRSPATCPYHSFICLNSGSEAMTVATRISDVNAAELTKEGGRYHGRRILFLGLKGGFHGRTCRPAQASDSSRGKYQVMASFRDNKNLITVEPNNIEELKEVFERADKENFFIEAFLVEPVMGEGNPGLAITPEFYQEARRLTEQHGAMLVMDSIQAGLRAQGVLSICDYPGFEHLPCPDMESFSKAINAGQFPLSVLAMSEKCAKLYRPGIYGNTMTSNAKALETAVAVLQQCDAPFEATVQNQGRAMVRRLEQVKDRFPALVTKVQGTGLIISLELVEGIKVYGANSVEDWMRRHGVNVIHGGARSLRFTPRFLITDAEIDLIAEVLEAALEAFQLQ
jgi:acetylornithine/succinyldiaminopimelate/putrescine aminotransferase